MEGTQKQKKNNQLDSLKQDSGSSSRNIHNNIFSSFAGIKVPTQVPAQSLCGVWLFATPCIVAYQGPCPHQVEDSNFWPSTQDSWSPLCYLTTCQSEEIQTPCSPSPQILPIKNSLKTLREFGGLSRAIHFLAWSKLLHLGWHCVSHKVSQII